MICYDVDLLNCGFEAFTSTPRHRSGFLFNTGFLLSPHPDPHPPLDAFPVHPPSYKCQHISPVCCNAEPETLRHCARSARPSLSVSCDFMYSNKKKKEKKKETMPLNNVSAHRSTWLELCSCCVSLLVWPSCCSESILVQCLGEKTSESEPLSVKPRLSVTCRSYYGCTMMPLL